MANKRLELHEKLCDILGSRHVYYQPPESIKMQYPAIVYKFVGYRTFKADNTTFLKMPEYDVTYISDDPDVDIADEMFSEFQYCNFDRPYVAENLHHFVYSIFY